MRLVATGTASAGGGQAGGAGNAVAAAARRGAGARGGDVMVADRRRCGRRSWRRGATPVGPRPYGYLGLGEVFVFVFFGLVATVGTTYRGDRGRCPGITWVAATGVGFLACALLVINNLRDIPTDRAVGKRTLAVRLGDRRTRGAVRLVDRRRVLARRRVCRSAQLVAAGAGALPVGREPIRKVLAGASGKDLIPILGATGKTQLLYGVLFSIGLALG